MFLFKWSNNKNKKEEQKRKKKKKEKEKKRFNKQERSQWRRKELLKVHALSVSGFPSMV